MLGSPASLQAGQAPAKAAEPDRAVKAAGFRYEPGEAESGRVTRTDKSSSGDAARRQAGSGLVAPL
jgi:hypothetical protein